MTSASTPTLRTGGLAPPVSALPRALPSDRLTASGRPVPQRRAELRHIPDAANAARVTWIWVQAFGAVALASWIDRPLAWVVVFVVLSRVIVLCNILTHEAVHRLLFSNRRVNDLVGRWLLASPVLVPYDAYRRAHMAHHRDAFGPDEPDLLLYANYPIPRSSMRRKLVRDLFLVSGTKLLRNLVRSLGLPSARPVVVRMLAVQAVLWVAFWVIGAWWVYPLCWLLPWLTVWRVLARLRAIAEHGGMRRSEDEREVSHHVRQRWLAKLWLVPYNTGYHLAHHVDPGLPFSALPALHRDLTDAGWVTDALVHPSYRALWRRQVS